MRAPDVPPRKLTDLPNIGRVTAEKLGKIGLTTVDEFLARDPYEVFDELLARVDPTLCRCALACIVGAGKGRPWHQVTGDSAREYDRRHPGHKWGPC